MSSRAAIWAERQAHIHSVVKQRTVEVKPVCKKKRRSEHELKRGLKADSTELCEASSVCLSASD